MKGKFLVVEGLDGSGKSTQLKLIAKALRKNGYKVFVTDEPWKNGLRDLIKKKFVSKKSTIDDGIVDALLFTTDRRMHVTSEIIPQLNKNDVVVCDRYYHSTLAYQSTQGVDPKWLIEINKFAPKPDLTLLYDVSPSKSLKRIIKEKRSKVDKFEKLSFLKKLRKNYLKLPELLKKEKIVIINANKSINSVFEDTKRAIRKELKLRI